MLGLIGKKKGMTQIFDENGNIVPVTVVELGPCTVVQIKTKDSDGYCALQLGYGIKKASRVTKAMRGHFEKNGLPMFTHLSEFRLDDVSGFTVGDELLVTALKPGDKVDVAGTTKGRGFQGVMKRHGKHGGPATHGSHFHRTPGSIGMRTWPARVFKNTKLPGHMGVESVTIQNLEVVNVRGEDNVVLVRGALPGHNDAVVEITLRNGSLATRESLKKVTQQKEQESKVSAEENVKVENENNTHTENGAGETEQQANSQQNEKKE